MQKLENMLKPGAKIEDLQRLYGITPEPPKVVTETMRNLPTKSVGGVVARIGGPC